ncbi:MAG: S-layer homology domain-containing protein, partial [Roseburia sp.]|nr:S-layer homology domain-containing protein [Roseburia sp.]
GNFAKVTFNVTDGALTIEPAPKVTLKYASMDESMGTVNPASETLDPYFGKATGAVAVAKPGYMFGSWTKDGSEVSKDAAFVPEKEASDKWVDGTTYIANWLVDRNGNNVDDTTEYRTVIYRDGLNAAVFTDQTYTQNADGQQLLDGDATPAFVGELIRSGYTFVGWTPVVIEKVNGDAVYVAGWAPNVYTVTYDLDGGAMPEGVTNPTSYTVEDADFTLNAPTKDGYVFDGWTGSRLTDKTVNVMVDTAWIQNLAYTANWLVDANRDGVADKYQVTLEYKAASYGTVSGETTKVITLIDADGNYVERLENRVPGTDGISVIANTGYTTNGWDVDPTRAMTYVGGETYTFTALFRVLSGGGSGGGGGSRPTPPAEEDLDDPDVPLAQLPALNTKDHVAYLIGRPDGTIAPMDNITRGEVATIFFRLLTEESRSANWATNCDYVDMTGAEYFNNSVSTITKAGLIRGYDDGTFGGGRKITRAEMATIAARFLSDPYDGENLFADIDGHLSAEFI